MGIATEDGDSKPLTDVGDVALLILAGHPKARGYDKLLYQVFPLITDRRVWLMRPHPHLGFEKPAQFIMRDNLKVPLDALKLFLSFN